VDEVGAPWGGRHPGSAPVRVLEIIEAGKRVVGEARGCSAAASIKSGAPQDVREARKRVVGEARGSRR
jgi:hypothetical protein